MDLCDRVIYFDGDDIGSQIELLLLDERLDEASTLSRRFSEALAGLHKSLLRIPKVQIRLFGGDDLIAQFPSDALSSGDVAKLRSEYKSACGSTISAGAGKSASEALSNLRRAKLMGRNRFFGEL